MGMTIRAIGYALAVMFAVVAPASAAMHGHGGGASHGGGGFHGGGMHGGGWRGGGERDHHGSGFWRDGVWYACNPFRWADGVCPDEY